MPFGILNTATVILMGSGSGSGNRWVCAIVVVVVLLRFIKESCLVCLNVYIGHILNNNNGASLKW